jgi:hypothetical protein
MNSTQHQDIENNIFSLAFCMDCNVVCYFHGGISISKIFGVSKKIFVPKTCEQSEQFGYCIRRNFSICTGHLVLMAMLGWASGCNGWDNTCTQNFSGWISWKTEKEIWGRHIKINPRELGRMDWIWRWLIQVRVQWQPLALAKSKLWVALLISLLRILPLFSSS